MVVSVETQDSAALYELLSGVTDPEIPVLTLQDLGVLRDITVTNGAVKVTITPTYSGCPAMETMRDDIEDVLTKAGYSEFTVEQSLSPAWTTDWMSENGREKLRKYGIAPPISTNCGQQTSQIKCPQCSGTHVKLVSEFGSTACKALYQCQDCREPFDYFKCI
jgi:ring-1,2-phenylacetyl-CoA epoxidase subunit PaaD